MRDPNVWEYDPRRQHCGQVIDVKIRPDMSTVSRFDPEAVYGLRVQLQCPTTDCHLTYSVSKLHLVSRNILPAIIGDMYEDFALFQFVDRNIEAWRRGRVMASIKCGSQMPTFSVELRQFNPRGIALQHHLHHMRMGSAQRRSLHLGMEQIDIGLLQLCEGYVKDIVSHHMDKFAGLYCADEDNRFPEHVFRLITSCGEYALMQDVHQLLVVTFIMTHTLTVSELFGVSKDMSDTVASGKFVTSRLTNRQVKSVFYFIQKRIMNKVFLTLQKTFESADGCDWLPAFVAVVGICLVCEEQQKNIHNVMETKCHDTMQQSTTNGATDSEPGHSTLRQIYERAGEVACRDIDSAIDVVIHWFLRCSGRPLQSMVHSQDSEVVVRVMELLEQHDSFFEERQRISIAAANWPNYTLRSVAKFLVLLRDSH